MAPSSRKWRFEHKKYIDSFEQNGPFFCCAGTFSLATRLYRTLQFVHWHPTVPWHTDAGADQVMEGSMQLRVGLNIAAAIMSFAFLAAVVLGMV